MSMKFATILVRQNVVIDALRRKEQVKPRRVRAMAMTIQYGVRGMILAAQSEAFKRENILEKGFMEIGGSSLIGPELVQDTNKVVLVKEKPKAAGDRQKSYADNRRKPLEFEVGDRVMLNVSLWKGVIRFGKKGKLAPRYVGPFEILERIGPVAYRLRLPEELSGVHDTFHVSNLKKCLADASLHVPLDEIKVYKTLHFVEEPVENSDCEVIRFLTSFLDDGRGSGSWMFLFVWSGYAAMRTLLWAGKVVSKFMKLSRFVLVFVEAAKQPGMDWLSKRKFVIVCYEKVVRIPLESDKILRVHGERTLGVAKALMNAKVDEPRINDIPMARDFIDVFPKELSMTPQRQVEFRIGLVHGATPFAKSPYRLAPIELTHCILANLNSH
ncbi:hypothetical protein Tco_0949161 [Tanacetum coccineum]